MPPFADRRSSTLYTVRSNLRSTVRPRRQVAALYVRSSSSPSGISLRSGYTTIVRSWPDSGRSEWLSMRLVALGTSRRVVTCPKRSLSLWQTFYFGANFLNLWRTFYRATVDRSRTVTLIRPSPTSPNYAACPHPSPAPAPCDTPAAAAPPRAGSATAGRSAPANGSRAGLRPT